MHYLVLIVLSIVAAVDVLAIVVSIAFVISERRLVPTTCREIILAPIAGGLVTLWACAVLSGMLPHTPCSRIDYYGHTRLMRTVVGICLAVSGLCFSGLIVACPGGEFSERLLPSTLTSAVATLSVSLVYLRFAAAAK